MRRIHLAALGLVSLVLLAGCFGYLTNISDERLCQGADYDFSTEANATYTLNTNGTYRAVYELHNRSRIELYRTDGLGNERPLKIGAVRFRAANGTTYGCKAIDVKTTQRRTVVTLPADNGTFAYTGRTSPKQFATRTFVEGSHVVVLPPNRTVENPIFASVSPGGFETRRGPDGRVRIVWEDVEARSIAVRYYMERDLGLLAIVVALAALAAAVGLAYYYRLVRRLRKRREELGVDVDVEDDDRDPPPGMG